MSKELEPNLDVSTNPNDFNDIETEGENPTNENNKGNEHDADYWKEKFKFSQKGAMELLEEKKRLLAEKEELEKAENKIKDEPLYPGFENLSEEEQMNIKAYTESITKKVLSNIQTDDTFRKAQEIQNETKWENAFNKVASAYPDLLESKEDFKEKYFQKHNVPDNIDVLLTDLAKVYLFDKAKSIGAKEVIENSKRINPLRTTTSSIQEPRTFNKTLDEWEALRQSNPSKFASMSKKFDEDVENGLFE